MNRGKGNYRTVNLGCEWTVYADEWEHILELINNMLQTPDDDEGYNYSSVVATWEGE